MQLDSASNNEKAVNPHHAGGVGAVIGLADLYRGQGNPAEAAMAVARAVAMVKVTAAIFFIGPSFGRGLRRTVLRELTIGQ